MAQLSRPYQILLGVVVVFGLIWAVALRGHAAKPGEASSSTPQPTKATSGSSANGTSGGNSAAPSSIYHGQAPGVEGLSRAIAKAHGAVAQTQQNVQEQETKSRVLSGESQPSTTTPPAATGSSKTGQGTTVTRKATIAPTYTHVHTSATSTPGGTSVHRTTTAVHSTPKPIHGIVAPTNQATVRAHAHPKPTAARKPEQVAVEHELAQGKTAILLFWNPKSTVDQEVRTQAGSLSRGSKGTVTLHLARANQVGMFGTFTEVVHVYQTPTILIVNKHGLVSTLTGLTDVFALEQAVHEARSAGS